MEVNMETQNIAPQQPQIIASEFLVQAGKLGSLSQVSGAKVIHNLTGGDYHQVVISKTASKSKERLPTNLLNHPLHSTGENISENNPCVSVKRSEKGDHENAAEKSYSVSSSSSLQLNVTPLVKERSEQNESPIVIIENVSKIVPIGTAKNELLDTTNTTSVVHLGSTSQTIASVEDGNHSKDAYRCEECDYSSTNKHYLKQHVDLVHNADRPYKCPFCDYAGKRSHSLKEHLIVHSNERPFECSHCNATFRKKGHLTNHTKLHQKAVHCPLCQKSVMQADLESHSKTVHNVENVFVCELCNFIAPDEQKIIEHMKEHKSQQIYVCSSCNYMTREYSAFVAHAQTHQTDIPAEKLKQDETVVIKSPPPPPPPSQVKKDVLVKCSECGFVATSSEVMKSHMWKHIKSEDLPQADDKLPQTTSRKTPTTSASEKSVYKCVDCEFVCEEAYNFVVHMLSHRPELQYIQPQVLQDQNKGAGENLAITKSTTSLPLSVEQTPPKSNNIPTTDTFSSVSTSSVASSDVTAGQNVTIASTSVEFPAKAIASAAPLSRQQNIPSTSVCKRDLKLNIFSKRPNILAASASSPPVEKTQTLPPTSKEMPAFVHDKVNGRFLCTICGYTCEYQRTIKAHIWKHSGNKDIEYPMFQNGPLSIYDESPFVREEITTQTGTNSGDQKVQVTKEGPVSLSSNPANKQTGNAVSSVASALANLLAARAMTGLTKNSGNVGNEYDNGSQVEISDKEQMKNTETNSNCQIGVKERIHAKVIHNIQAKVMEKLKICSVPTSESSSNKYMEASEIAGSMGTSSTEDIDGEEKKEKWECEDSPESMIIVEELEEKGKCGSKRKIDASAEYEQTGDRSQAVFCSEEKKQKQGNVVVESVDTLQSLTGYTGMKSQQNSPRSSNIAGSSTETENDVVSTVFEQDCSDSGIASDRVSTDTHVQPSIELQSVKYQRKSARLQQKELKLAPEFPRIVTNENESVKETVSIDQEDDNDTIQNRSSISESAVTLLSLLKKGPNYNPACPVIANQTTEISEVKEAASKEKPKSRGISSSLLAVIEQLRERSRSETEIDESGNKKIIAKKKIKKESVEDVAAMESFDNVERIEEEEEELRFRCKLCHYSNSSTFVMKQHMKLHKTKRPFECSLCVFIAESSEELQNHMIKHCKVRTYQCKLCPSAFNYKSQLRAHMRAHNEKDVFACDECEFESSTPSVLRNHVTEWHEIKQYVCENCEERFTSKQDLRTHKRLICLKYKTLEMDDQDSNSGRNEEESSSMMPKFRKQELKCSKCDYVTNSVVRFGNHEKTHEEPKNLKCDFCDFPALSNRSLKSHMKRHVNDQRFVQQPLEQYKCNLCGYVCHHLPSLKSHMWRHASDENYSYEFTNEVINAAIDYDSRLDSNECCKSDVEEFNRTIREKMRQRLESQGKSDTESAQYAVCWVTFRCCHCGYEVINKAQLNLHMKAHSDVIRWTLQVSQQGSPGNGSGSITSHDGKVLQRPEIEVKD